ncbi:hypothetical protein N7466_009996 [Penicillium verhagenii]|uniref:uncharacterized protein n=1 Tax=Penicillium verhagenii TaxID=1562060 RepID=UPI0025453ABA|nr:uncharacterized protein N7466_009996 [Penicillium verhagenii]KAJ5919053.1 hypothetical protein N7466_009996 [Penicillium verhagenii]
MSDQLDMSITSFDGVNHGIQIRDNPGNITAKFYNYPLRYLTVPFARDPHFVHRHTLFDQIQARSSVPGSKIALVGLGGVGKSQLVIEYSDHVRSKSPTTWVFWVHASNEARFKESIQTIANRLKLPGRQDPKISTLDLVEAWLQNEKNKWICILDNADDDKFLCLSSPIGKESMSKDSIHTPTKALIEYIPISKNGSIIITSRSREVALKMVHFKDIIDVNPMERSEALELLRNTLDKSEDLDQSEDSLSSQQLIKELDFMPLAIVQAASFIRERGCRYSVTQYLQEFQESDREAIKLLKKEPSYLNRVPEAKNSILVSWQISFDYIRHTKPSAADLLSLMSLFDREGIADTLIRPPWIKDPISDSVTCDGSSDEESSDSDDGPDFEDDILTLKNYSFIHENNTFFTMHRILHRGAWYAIEVGHLADAIDMASKSRKQLVKLLGAEDRSTLESTLTLTKAYLLDCQWEDAEKLGIQVMETLETKPDMDHFITMVSINNLASTYYSQGRWKEAEQLQIQVMEFSKAELGIDHIGTLLTMSNLASTYHSQGRWEEAEQLQIQVMEFSKAELGIDHLDTLRSMNSLALIYHSQGRWKEAEQLGIQVMETYKVKLGMYHPSTLTSMTNLASIILTY